MGRPRKNYFITAPNPDGRKGDLFFAACDSEADAQAKIMQLKLDIDHTHVFAGQHFPVRQQTLIILGEERKRRGRPPGSKNLTPEEKQARLEAKTKHKGKRKNGLRSKDVPLHAVVKRRPAKKVEAAPAVVPARRGRRAKETQADRNARVEAAT